MSSVDLFISELPDPQRTWMLQLQHFILSAAPGIQESIKWKVPFYTYKGMLCYLTPKKKYIDFGFVYGAYLSNANGLLHGEGKMVRHIKIHSEKDLNWEAINEVLQEALLYNETQKSNKVKTK